MNETIINIFSLIKSTEVNNNIIRELLEIKTDFSPYLIFTKISKNKSYISFEDIAQFLK